MPNRLVFVAVSDPRGDMDYVAKVVGFAAQKDVQAQAVFFLGNFCGPLLTKPEQMSIDSARRALQHELKTNDPAYRQMGVTSVARLVNEITGHPGRYQRGPEVAAANAFRSILGRRDDAGKVLEPGTAAKKAKAVYAQAAKIFAKSKVPCYVMGDTIFAEEFLPEEHWLHFSWTSVGGRAIRCLGASEIDDPEAVPDFFLGPRRGGRTVALDAYPMESADVIFAYVMNPVLHELLSTARQKLVVMCGDGLLDFGYERNVVARQRPKLAYAYTLDGIRMSRRGYTCEGGAFTAGAFEGDLDEISTRKHRAIEAQVKLAGLAKDLMVFIDLMRRENPELAATLESAENRGEAVHKYVQYLEAQRKNLESSISAERVALERVLSKVSAYLGSEQSARIHELLKQRPDPTAPVEAQDAMNVRIAETLSALLQQRFGPPPEAAAAPAEPPRATPVNQPTA